MKDTKKQEKQKEESQIVLGYWNIRGLAHPIRFLLEYFSVNYREEIYQEGEPPTYSRECWYSVCSNLGMILWNLPYMFDGDLKISESIAIMR